MPRRRVRRREASRRAAPGHGGGSAVVSSGAGRHQALEGRWKLGRPPSAGRSDATRGEGGPVVQDKGAAAQHVAALAHLPGGEPRPRPRLRVGAAGGKGTRPAAAGSGRRTHLAHGVDRLARRHRHRLHRRRQRAPSLWSQEAQQPRASPRLLERRLRLREARAAAARGVRCQLGGGGGGGAELCANAVPARL
eukprot:scaffold11242_cov61-Phaeocystis_antarctica.AAC.1